MSEDKSLEQQKKEAAEKAKLEAKKKMEELKRQKEKVGSESEEAVDLAKKKAATAAKAKAQALLKQKEREAAKAESVSEEASDLVKKKAAAAAKAKAQALAKQKAAQSIEKSEDELAKEKAKAVAAAKAKAAAAAKAKASSLATPEEPQQELLPSLNQPLLDKYVKVIQEHLGEEILEEYYINRLSKDVPTLVAKPHTYFKVAEFLKYNERLGFDYLSELHGTDFQTHFELYVHLYSYKNRQSVALKTKIDREKGTIASIAPLWAGADWPEREAYDLLGIIFEGHPNLKRIMLPDDWVGYPLRKDYEPYDVEV